MICVEHLLSQSTPFSAFLTPDPSPGSRVAFWSGAAAASSSCFKPDLALLAGSPVWKGWTPKLLL